MRLIDADTFAEACRKKLDRKALYSPVCIEVLVVDRMPTVDAFPLEWLINKYPYATEDILKDWERYLNEQAERKEETERTCYNCKHGAYGFDSDLGCSLWHRGKLDAKNCQFWEGAKEE